MAKASAAQLEDQSFEFALLLPDDDAGLAERSGALFEWCRGFLGAFGLAAGKDPPLSDESREALTDIARLAAASPQDDGDEEDEQALAEIEEFVRVRSEEHTSELQSLMRNSYADFCLKKKNSITHLSN